MASYVDLRKSGDPSKAKSKRPHLIRYRDHTGASRSDSYSRKAEADKRLREVQTLEETGKLDLLDAGNETLAELGAKFFALEKSAWNGQTPDQQRYLWNSVVLGKNKDGSAHAKNARSAIADLPIAQIRASHVKQFREEALAAGIPASSITRAKSLITRALDMAVEDDLIPANPAARVKAPKAKPVGAIVVLTPAEVEKLRAGFEDERDKVFISILAYAGLRPHEALALHAKDFGGDELHLTHGVGSKGELQALKAGHDERYVPICTALAADVKAVKWPTGPMFPNIHGDYRGKEDYDNWRNRRFAKAKKATKLPTELVPYDLRHSIASLWYREGIDKATIADQLGHSIQVLETRYLHRYKQLDPGDRRTVDQMISDARGARAA